MTNKKKISKIRISSVLILGLFIILIFYVVAAALRSHPTSCRFGLRPPSGSCLSMSDRGEGCNLDLDFVEGGRSAVECFAVDLGEAGPLHGVDIDKINKKIAILIISISSEYIDTGTEIEKKRWIEEKKIWLSSIYNNTFKNIDVFFIESDSRMQPGTCLIKKNTIYCGGKECFTPGIFQKTILSLEFLHENNYDFYVRTNLSTVVNYRALNNYLKNIKRDIFFSTGKLCIHHDDSEYDLSEEHQIIKNKIISKIKKEKLPYYGPEIINNKEGGAQWYTGWTLIFSKKWANVLVQYKKIKYIMELKVPDDVLLGILINAHNYHITDKCKEWSEEEIISAKGLDKIIFHRCKEISKKKHKIISQFLLYDRSTG